MKPTERDLMVARAVWDAFIRRMYAFPHSAPSCDVDVAALLESLPEPAEYYRAAKCPVCDGTGLVSRPPGVAGDQPTWSSLSSGPFPCRSCGSTGVLHLSEPAGVKGPDKLGGNSEPAEHERHCSLCEGQYIHDECDVLGLGPPEPAEPEQAAQDADELTLRQKWMATVIAERDRQVAAARAEGKAEGLAEGARATFDAVEEVISRLSTAYSSGAVYLAAVKKFRPAQDEPAPTKPTREDLKAVLEGMLRAAQDEQPSESEYERGLREERERCKWHACYCSWSGDVFEECEICSGAPMRRAAQDEHGGKGEA